MNPATARERLLSLDITRGLTVALMILVNNNGDKQHTWALLEHAPWNGFTVADFVFPAFLFMVGMSIELSFRARLAKGMARSTIALGALRRSVVLILIGLFISAYPHFHFGTMRFYGVLQRIGLCFVAAAVIVLWTRTRGLCGVAVGLLVVYWVLLRFVPVPGIGVPTHEVAMLDPFGNVAAWIDRAIFGTGRLYQHGVYDPCGLLGTLPAIVSVFVGVLVARWMAGVSDGVARVKGLAVAAVVLVAAGLAWSPWFAINKRMWTSSYVLFAGGLAVGLFAVVYAVSDLGKSRGWWMTPWLAFGTNALVAYIFSELLAATLDNIRVGGRSSLRWVVYRPFRGVMPGVPEFGSLLYAVVFTVICLVPVWWLYRRKIVIKL